MSEKAQWLHLDCERVLYVDRGREIILCDRALPTELMVLVLPASLARLATELPPNSNDEAAA